MYFKTVYCVRNYDENGRWYYFDTFDEAKNYVITFLERLINTTKTDSLKQFLYYCEIYKNTKSLIDVEERSRYVFLNNCGLLFEKDRIF